MFFDLLHKNLRFISITAILFLLLPTQVKAQEGTTADVVDSQSAHSVIRELRNSNQLKDKPQGGGVALRGRNAPTTIDSANLQAEDEVLARKQNSCRDENYMVITSADGEAISIFFNEFVVDPNNTFDPYLYLTENRRRSTAAKICHINIDVQIPNNWTFAIHSLSVLGYVNLATANDEAQYKLNYSFRNVRMREINGNSGSAASTSTTGGPASTSAGSGMTSGGHATPIPGGPISVTMPGKRFASRSKIKLNGPYSGELLHTADFKVWTFAPCHRPSGLVNLSLNSSATLNSVNSDIKSSYLAVDLIDSVFTDALAGNPNARAVRYGLKWVECTAYRNAVNKVTARTGRPTR